MKSEITITKQVTYTSCEHNDNPESIELTFDCDDLTRIAKVQTLVKENNLHSAKINFGGFVPLNDEGEEERNFLEAESQLIIYEDSFVFYAQDEDCNQIEAEFITLDELYPLFNE